MTRESVRSFSHFSDILIYRPAVGTADVEKASKCNGPNSPWVSNAKGIYTGLARR